MNNTLYDMSVLTCLQVVNATLHNLDKAEIYYKENDLEVDTLANVQLHDDMRPLRYQIYAVALHSRDAMKALTTGSFYRPTSYPEELNYSQIQNYLREALDELQAYTPEAVNALNGQTVTVKIPNLDIPFEITDYVLSFMHVNLYFHATTAYNILRMKGIPIDKRDFLGEFRLKN